jgi:hypothetical protein
VVSANSVDRTLRRHGLTPTRRLSLIAGYRTPYPPPREPELEVRVTSARPGELVGMGCFDYVGRLHGTAGTVRQDLRDRHLLRLRWADLVTAPNDGPAAEHASRLAPADRRRTERDGVAA